jgi:hypothetical protein
MQAIHRHRNRRLVLVAAAAVAVPAALPSGAAAHHECNQSHTLVTVNPSNTTEPVDVDHRLPIIFSCGPHRIGVIYVDQNGTSSELIYRQGEATLTHTSAEREPARTNTAPPAEPAQQSRPARRAKRSCRKYRRAKTSAQRRAARRCRARNRSGR